MNKGVYIKLYDIEDAIDKVANFCDIYCGGDKRKTSLGTVSCEGEYCKEAYEAYIDEVCYLANSYIIVVDGEVKEL